MAHPQIDQDPVNVRALELGAKPLAENVKMQSMGGAVRRFIIELQPS